MADDSLTIQILREIRTELAQMKANGNAFEARMDANFERNAEDHMRMLQRLTGQSRISEMTVGSLTSVEERVADLEGRVATLEGRGA